MLRDDCKYLPGYKGPTVTASPGRCRNRLTKGSTDGQQPSAPNPYATAAAQNQQNQQASQYNSAASNANEVNPYGTVSYKAIEQVPIYGPGGQVTGYAPRYERTTTLSPDQQKLLGLETQSKYNMGTTAVEQSANLREHLTNNQLDPSQWQAWGAAPGKQDLRQDAGPTDRAGIEKSMMESYNRTAKGQEAGAGSELAARGLVAGWAGLRQLPDAARRQPRRGRAQGLPHLGRREPQGAGRLQRRRHATLQHGSGDLAVLQQFARRRRRRKPSRCATSRSTKSRR